MNKAQQFAIIGVLALLAGCQQEPAVFEVPASINYHEPDKAFLMYVPAGDVTFLRNVASVVIPAFNERRKLTVDEGQRVARFYDEYQVFFRVNERSRATELMSFFTDHPGFTVGISAAECDRRIASIAEAFRLMRSFPSREEAKSDKEFNQWLGALFNSDKSMARTMLAFCDQVLKVQVKHPDLTEQPVVFKSGFELERYAPDGTPKNQPVTIAFVPSTWEYIHGEAKKVVAAGRDAFGYQNLKELKDAWTKSQDAGKEQIAWGNMNEWAYPQASGQTVIWPPFLDLFQFTTILSGPDNYSPDDPPSAFDQGWAFLQILASDE